MKTAMRALVNTGPQKLELMEQPSPEPGDGQVVVETLSCGICSTDLHMIAGWSRTGFPSIPGHEWCGRIHAVGAGVHPRLIGIRCVGHNVLADGGEVGFEHPGAYGEFFVTEASAIHPIPASIPTPVAPLAEPLAVCVRASERGRLGSASKLLIVGDGPIGLLLTHLASRYAVPSIVVLGMVPGRLAAARSLGARHALADPYSEVISAGGFDVVFEASGSPDGIRVAMEVAGSGGRVVILGYYGEARADFRWNRLLHKEITMVGSNTGNGGWKEAIRILEEGREKLARLVTNVVQIDQYTRAFELLQHRDNNTIKAVLSWDKDVPTHG